MWHWLKYLGIKRKIAAVCSFAPIHDGHIEHIRLASKLGNHLIVIVDNDSYLLSKYGYCFLPIEARLTIARSIRWVDEVVPSIDDDGTCAKTLKLIKPQIFAKGGDRTENNMPENEIEACREIGCKIVYGVGEQLNSTSRLLKESHKILDWRDE